MKKIICALLCVIMIFSLVACGNKQTNEPEKTAQKIDENIETIETKENKEEKNDDLDKTEGKIEESKNFETIGDWTVSRDVVMDVESSAIFSAGLKDEANDFTAFSMIGQKIEDKIEYYAFLCEEKAAEDNIETDLSQDDIKDTLKIIFITKSNDKYAFINSVPIDVSEISSFNVDNYDFDELYMIAKSTPIEVKNEKIADATFETHTEYNDWVNITSINYAKDAIGFA